MLSGYIDIGIEKNSDDFNKAIELLKNNGLPQNILIDHELNSDYVRVVLPNKDHIDTLALHHQIVNNGQLSIIKVPLTDAQKYCEINI